MELPLKLLQEVALKARHDLKEQMLIAIDTSIHEQHCPKHYKPIINILKSLSTLYGIYL